VALQEPAPDAARLQSSGAEIAIPEADRGVGVDVVDQGLQPSGELPFPAERPADLAGPVAAEKRLTRGAEKFDIFALWRFSGAGRTATGNWTLLFYAVRRLIQISRR
jgi:hypothetical protein